MKTIQRSALVMHSAERMYELVNDVAAYPEFLPWCTGSEVLDRGSEHQEARVDVSRTGISSSFITRNAMVPGERIEMALEKGPFKSLAGAWTFHPLQEDACKVSLDLSFEMDGGLLQAAVGKIFEQAAVTMVDAFCSRADQVYG